MKFLPVLLFSLCGLPAASQNIQLQYDMRHTIDPADNATNFPTFYIEYFKNQDSGNGFFKPGSFLVKLQADLLGQDHNIGKAYVQISQSFRCWKPKIFLHLQYSGGLGITEPKQYSYYIVNTFSIGPVYPFRWGNAYLSALLNYKYVPYTRPTHDAIFTLYWWKGLWNYKGELAGDFSAWTENKNHGDDPTKDLRGKRFYFFAEPQVWYHVNSVLSFGVRMNTYYQLLGDGWKVYPAVAVRAKL